MQAEQRKHSRIPIELRTELTCPDGSIFHGITKNLSFGGAFVSCDESMAMPKLGDCALKLILGVGVEKESASIEIAAQVIRLSENSVGIMFLAISVDDYNHFKNLMIFNSSDPETLMSELEKHPGIDKIKE